MATPNSVVVIVGSLRKESFTLKFANALTRLAPDTLKLNVVRTCGGRSGTNLPSSRGSGCPVNVSMGVEDTSVPSAA